MVLRVPLFEIVGSNIVRIRRRYLGIPVTGVQGEAVVVYVLVFLPWRFVAQVDNSTAL